MFSKLRAPQESGEMGRIVQKIYDDLNSIIDNMNTDLKGEVEPDEKGKEGSVAVVKDGNRYTLQGKTADGWAKVNMTLRGSSKTPLINTEELFTSSDNIGKLTDSTTGSVSNTIDHTSTDVKDDIASLNAKLNTVIDIVNKHNSIINKLINKINKLIREQ